MTEAKAQNPAWWCNLRLARAGSCYLSEARGIERKVTALSESKVKVIGGSENHGSPGGFWRHGRDIVLVGNAAQGNKGRGKYPGFPLLFSSTN